MNLQERTKKNTRKGVFFCSPFLPAISGLPFFMASTRVIEKRSPLWGLLSSIGHTQPLNRLCEALPKQSRVRAVDSGLLRFARKDEKPGFMASSI